MIAPGRSYRFVQVDVFTDRPFGGNPLAVFLDGDGLSDAEMQAIAREMNLSETTFVLPPLRTDCAASVRIFTPGRELPFAGHPTLGTAFVLATHGRTPAGASAFCLQEGIGPVEVRLEGGAAAPDLVWMRHPAARFGPPLADRDAVAGALRLTGADLLPEAPIAVGSTGLPFLYVPLRNPATVDRAALDVPAFLDRVPDPDVLGAFVFAPDREAGTNRVYSRMFAPHTAGIPEDPATGSASGPLGAYLVRNGLAAPGAAGAPMRIVSEQGTKMGRQSFVHIQVRGMRGMRGMRGSDEDGEIEVGGAVVPVLDGTLRLS